MFAKSIYLTNKEYIIFLSLRDGFYVDELDLSKDIISSDTKIATFNSNANDTDVIFFIEDIVKISKILLTLCNIYVIINTRFTIQEIGKEIMDNIISNKISIVTEEE